MSYNSKSNKKPKSETILVATAGQALLATGDLVNPSSSALNIANGQLGAVVATHNSATRAYGAMLQAGDTAAQVDTIQLVQGTPNSSNINNVYPISAIGHKEVVRSQKIYAKNGLLMTAKVCEVPLLDVHLVGGTGGAITVQDQADYALNIQFVSTRNDKYFSAHGNENLSINFTTPNYTVLSTTSGLDHLVKNLVYQANLNSAALNFNNPASRRGNKNFIAFAVDVSGGGTGITLEDIEVGVAFTVAVDSAGNNVQYTPDDAFVASIQELVTNSILTNASTIEVANLTTAGSVAYADCIVLVSQDHSLAIARDDISQTKVRLRVGLEYKSFVASTPPNVSREVKAYEGQGQGRKWKLQYESRAALNIFTAQNRHQGPQEYITPPTYIDEDTNYTAYILEHNDSYNVQASHTSTYYHRTIILVPCTEQAETFTFLVTAASTGADTVTFNINGTAYEVTTITATGSTNAAAAEIKVRWDALGFNSAYTLGVVGSTITFTATDTNPKSGTLSLTNATDLAGTFTTTVQGGSFVTDSTVKTSLNAVLGPWINNANSLGYVEALIGTAALPNPFA